MELFAKKKSAEKENLIRVIAQTNKKIDYLKEFRVYCVLFRLGRSIICQYWNDSRKERIPIRHISSRILRRSSISIRPRGGTFETTSRKKSTISRNYKSIN